MPKVNKDKKSEVYYLELVELFSKVESNEEVEDLLQGLLTPQELEQLVLRLQIVKKLKNKEPQRQIAEDLGVGIATVTRGSRELRKGRFGMI